MNTSGLTLIELLVTIAVAAIVLAFAVPSFQETLIQNRLMTQINDLALALNLVRSEAVKRAVTVSLCKSADGNSCGGAGVTWEQGWLVFVNTDNDNPAAVDAGEPIVRVNRALLSGYTLRGDTNFSSYVSYQPTGESNATGRFVLCEGSNLTHARAIFINTAGRISLGQDANGDRIPEDESGTNITSCTP